MHAGDVKLDKFIDATTLTAASTLPRSGAQVRTVLLTGATGFLGRFLALEWLERLAPVGGSWSVWCGQRTMRRPERGWTRRSTVAIRRCWRTIGSWPPSISRSSPATRAKPNLGLDQQTWQRLADTVDLIVDPAALVNHVLPYSELFGPNVVGTAELIRIALTTRLKPYTYVSTVGVGARSSRRVHRGRRHPGRSAPTRTIDDSYANGYGNSKWAGEVLLREAHDLCGLPVAVFRCDMILADTTYAGQLNVPDMFTRMMLSLVATGIAPGSFYELDADGNRQRAHFDGLPVEFIAEAIATLGAQVVDGFRDLPRDEPVRRRHRARRVRRLADRGRLPDPAHR